MTSYVPPVEITPIFNSKNFDEATVSQRYADNKYLIKVIPDKAISLESFLAGIETQDINSNTDILNLATNTTNTTLNIGNSVITNNITGISNEINGPTVITGSTEINGLTVITGSTDIIGQTDITGALNVSSDITTLTSAIIGDSATSATIIEPTQIMVKNNSNKFIVKINSGTGCTVGTFNSMDLKLITNNTTRATINSTGTSFNISNGTQLNLSDTTNSTSLTTGSLITNGGIGVNKNMYIGGLVDIVGNIEVDGQAKLNGGLSTYLNQTPFKIQSTQLNPTSGNVTWTFPSAYTSNPTVTATAYLSGEVNMRPCLITSLSSTSVTIRCVKTDNSSCENTVLIQIIAIG